MINFRALKNLTFPSLAEVSRAFQFVQRSIVDALTDLDNRKATALIAICSDRTDESVQYDRHLMMFPAAGATVKLPSATVPSRRVAVTNGTSAVNVSVLSSGTDTVMGVLLVTVSPRTTLQLTSDGKGGWW